MRLSRPKVLHQQNKYCRNKKLLKMNSFILILLLVMITSFSAINQAAPVPDAKAPIEIMNHDAGRNNEHTQNMNRMCDEIIREKRQFGSK
jgi:hypothetical protein